MGFFCAPWQCLGVFLLQQQQFGQQYGGGNYYNMGYWGYPQGYQGVQQGSYMQPTAYMQQGYGYPRWGARLN